MHASQYDIETRAMLIHHSKSSGAIDVTVHNVIPSMKGRDTVGAGRVLGAEEKAELVSILQGDTSMSFELQSDKILSSTPYGLAWWMPKGERDIMFRTDNKNIVTHTVTFPTVVGIYLRGTLHFAVTKGGKSTRPSAETPLFHVPLPNLYEGGTFCRGSAQVPSSARQENIPAWTSFLFDTVNTH